MDYLQAIQAPVVRQFGKYQFRIPKMTLGALAIWQAEISQARQAKALEGLEDAQRREYETFYPAIPPTINEMRNIVRGAEGAKRVLEDCLPLATVVVKFDNDPQNGQSVPAPTAEEAKQMANAMGLKAAVSLAFDIADLNDNTPAPVTKPEGGPAPDPLPKPEKQG